MAKKKRKSSKNFPELKGEAPSVPQPKKPKLCVCGHSVKLHDHDEDGFGSCHFTVRDADGHHHSHCRCTRLVIPDMQGLI